VNLALIVVDAIKYALLVGVSFLQIEKQGKSTKDTICGTVVF